MRMWKSGRSTSFHTRRTACSALLILQVIVTASYKTSSVTSTYTMQEYSCLYMYSDNNNIIEFTEANQVLDGYLKQMKRDGLATPTQHKPPISDEDKGNIYRHYSRRLEKPLPASHLPCLVRHHFCLRGSEIQAHLTARLRRIMLAKSWNYAFMDSRIMLAKSSYYALARGDTYSFCCTYYGASKFGKFCLFVLASGSTRSVRRGMGGDGT